MHMREDKCIEKFCRVGGAEREGAVYAVLYTLSFVHRGHGYLSVVSVVCCQVEVSATS